MRASPDWVHPSGPGCTSKSVHRQLYRDVAVSHTVREHARVHTGPKAPLNSGSTGRIEGGWGPLLPFDSWLGVARIKAVQPDLKALFAAIDFVGVSNYAR